VEIAIDKDDTTELKQNIQAFVADFNSASDLINEQFVVNDATGSTGPLAGDSTIRNLQARLRNLISSRIEGLDEGFNSLVLIGISFTRDARLSIDDERLNEALSENLDKVRALFVAQGNTVGAGVEFIASTKNTTPGQHAVNVTAAPEKALLLGSMDLNVGLDEDQTLTITGKSGDIASRISLLAGDRIDDIVTKINASLASEVAETRRATRGNTIGTATDSTTSVNTDTTFDQIFGGSVEGGDTIRIQGTTHSGVTVTRTFQIDDASTKTIGDLLTDIRSAFNGGISASLDAEGKIVISDNQVGTSRLTVTLVEENEGGGSLDFGSIEVEEEGRLSVQITAANQDGKLSLEHESFGSRHGFTVTQSLDQLGLAAEEVTGADVEGTIKGEAATGLGRVLTGALDNVTTEGLALRIITTPEELAAGGNDLGTVEIIFGVGRLMNDELGFITDSFDGNLKNRQNAIDDTLDNLDDQIEAMERRVAKVREGLVRKFAALEGAMAALNAQGSFLSTQLASFNR